MNDAPRDAAQPSAGAPVQAASEALLAAAADLARRIGARALLLAQDCLPDETAARRLAASAQLVLVQHEGRPAPQGAAEAAAVLHMPAIKLTRMGQIKMALLSSLSRGVFHRGDVVVCVAGSPLERLMDTLLVVRIGEEHEAMLGPEAQDLTADVRPEVFEKVLDLAVQLANEGRDGKPIGTIFVIGDSEAVRSLTQQLIINPFRGYAEEERNILDPRLTETIKELAAIDGAFIIREDGVVLSAGTYLKPGLAGEALPTGLGARHAAANSLSASTRAIVLTVSESTGMVRVFRDGRVVTEIERPSRSL